MKKIILFFTFYSICTFSFGQEFLGIKVDGKMDAVVNAFKSKGFKLEPGSDTKDIAVVMTGVAGVTNVKIGIGSSPKSKTVWKITVYLPEQISWISLKNEYEEYLQLLTEKYGEPKKHYAFFSSPYEEGDGNEMTAVKAEKCNYAALWSTEIGVYIAISEFKRVKISYENSINYQLHLRETSELKKEIF